MELFLAALLIFGVAVLGMAVGAIFSNRRIRGSCGGLAGLRDSEGHTLCDACTTPSEECQGVDSTEECETAEVSGGEIGHC